MARAGAALLGVIASGSHWTGSHGCPTTNHTRYGGGLATVLPPKASVHCPSPARRARSLACVCLRLDVARPPLQWHWRRGGSRLHRHQHPAGSERASPRRQACMATIQLLAHSVSRAGGRLCVLYAPGDTIGFMPKGFNSKILRVYEALADAPADEIVCVVDAFDVLFTGSMKELLSGGDRHRPRGNTGALGHRAWSFPPSPSAGRRTRRTRTTGRDSAVAPPSLLRQRTGALPLPQLRGVHGPRGRHPRPRATGPAEPAAPTHR